MFLLFLCCGPGWTFSGNAVLDWNGLGWDWNWRACSLPDNQIVYASPAFHKMIGYAEGEIRGFNMRFLQGPHSDPSAARRMREGIHARRDVFELVLNYRKDRTPIWSTVFIAPLFNNEGRLVNYVGVHHEIPPRMARAMLDRMEGRLMVSGPAASFVGGNAWHLYQDGIERGLISGELDSNYDTLEKMPPVDHGAVVANSGPLHDTAAFATSTVFAHGESRKKVLS
jgi:PAS domain S-box-containing protein